MDEFAKNLEATYPRIHEKFLSKIERNKAKAFESFRKVLIIEI